MNFVVISYGCQMNEYDSARVSSVLELCGVQPVLNVADADIILINTCSVREKAEESAIARMRELRPLKLKNKHLKIGILGCMAKNRGATLLKELPFVDFVLPPDEYEKLPEIISGGVPPAPLPKGADLTLLTNRPLKNPVDAFAKLSNSYSAPIAIQSGCNMRCSYCIVPFVRGREEYRDPNLILREIENAVQNGISEIILLGQTVNGYRHKELSFADLLKKVAEVKGIERIRFMSPHPKHYTGELLNILLNEQKIAPHIHLPAQSGSNSILKKMKRQYTREEFLSIVEALRMANLFYGITTDLICGYPGETEAEFEETLSLLREAQFDNAFLFAYSPRKGTPSALEAETINAKEKWQRLQCAIDLQNSITLSRAKMMIGRKETILLERPSRRSAGEWIGKTGSFKKVIIPNSGNEGEKFREGMYIDCIIESVSGHTLRGKLLHSTCV
ncbi:tRNA-2-methylthio-N(6)-dimethylallyladenosine synthase [Fibrobacterales bacterium]|nr:tRNA-2-methylthio-N(6)-dimethylallyladenosine synthase [Fibrobacterales bacterium]